MQTVTYFEIVNWVLYSLSGRVDAHSDARCTCSPSNITVGMIAR